MLIEYLSLLQEVAFLVFHLLNSAPTAPTVSISADNDPAEVGVDDLTCMIDVEASDIDGDALTYVYTWYDEGGNWADESSPTTDLSYDYPGSGTEVGTCGCGDTIFGAAPHFWWAWRKNKP